jgi:hypothetical protein
MFLVQRLALDNVACHVGVHSVGVDSPFLWLRSPVANNRRAKLPPSGIILRTRTISTRLTDLLRCVLATQDE